METQLSESQFLDLCRLLALPTAFVSPAGVIVECSEAAAELLGWARSDLIGRPLVQFGSVPVRVVRPGSGRPSCVPAPGEDRGPAPRRPAFSLRPSSE